MISNIPLINRYIKYIPASFNTMKVDKIRVKIPITPKIILIIGMTKEIQWLPVSYIIFSVYSTLSFFAILVYFP